MAIAKRLQNLQNICSALEPGRGHYTGILNFHYKDHACTHDQAVTLVARGQLVARQNVVSRV